MPNLHNLKLNSDKGVPGAALTVDPGVVDPQL